MKNRVKKHGSEKTGSILQEYGVKYDGIAGRYGGDEFILILRDIDNPDELNTVLKELVDRLKFIIYCEDEDTGSLTLFQKRCRILWRKMNIFPMLPTLKKIRRITPSEHVFINTVFLSLGLVLLGILFLLYHILRLRKKLQIAKYTNADSGLFTMEGFLLFTNNRLTKNPDSHLCILELYWKRKMDDQKIFIPPRCRTVTYPKDGRDALSLVKAVIRQFETKPEKKVPEKGISDFPVTYALPLSIPLSPLQPLPGNTAVRQIHSGGKYGNWPMPSDLLQRIPVPRSSLRVNPMR